MARRLCEPLERAAQPLSMAAHTLGVRMAAMTLRGLRPAGCELRAQADRRAADLVGDRFRPRDKRGMEG